MSSLQPSLQRNKQAFFSETSWDRLIGCVLTSLVSFCYVLSVNAKIYKSLIGLSLESFNIQSTLRNLEEEFNPIC